MTSLRLHEPFHHSRGDIAFADARVAPADATDIVWAVGLGLAAGVIVYVVVPAIQMCGEIAGLLMASSAP